VLAETTSRDVALHRQDGRILGSFHTDWSDRAPPSIGSIIETGGMRTVRMTVDRDDASGTCEFVSLEPGLFLLTLDVALPQGMALNLVGEDLIEFHYRVSGSISLQGNWGDVIQDRPSMLLWHQPQGHDDVWEELGSADMKREVSATLYCKPEWLGRLIGYESALLPDDLRRILNRQSTLPTHRVLPHLPETSSIIHAILNDKESGPLRLVNMKARGYELLACALRSAASDSPPSRPLSDRDVKRIDDAREILEREFIHPPTMQALARRLGLNVNKLCNGLKARHGATGQHLIRAARLRRAYELLQSSDLQVSQVAYAVGYAHHSTFTAAFVERFGISPKALAANRNMSRN